MAEVCQNAQDRVSRKPLKFFEKAAQAVNLVGNAVGAQSVPIGGRVDGNYRLAEPLLSLGGEFHHAEIGTDLNDRIGILAIAVELNQLFAQHFRRHFSDPGPAFALETDVANDIKPRLGEIAPYFGIGDRIIRRDKCNALDPAVSLKCGGAGMGANADTDAGLLLDRLDKSIGA